MMQSATAGSVRAPHAAAARAEWARLQKTLAAQDAVSITGSDLSIADVVAVSLHGATPKLTNDATILQNVADSVDWLKRQLDDRQVIYGVNTGFGGSADTRTADFERLQSAAVQHLNVGILLQSDKRSKGREDGRPDPRRRSNELLRSHALPGPIVRAAMLIRCNSLLRGHSGVRISVIQSIMQLLARDMTPVVPLRGSISASGDLSTLSYVAGAIEGNPDIFVKFRGEQAKSMTLPANETLKLAGLEPVRLQAKEGLGITNGTAPSCAAAAIVMHQANQLAILVQLLTAMGTEALAGTAHNYHPFISSVRPHDGQTEAAANILSFLAGSKISPDREPERVGLAQDRYALRTAPQWIGPQLEDLALATRQVSTELNSTTDNPLIDAATGQVHHGGNFQAMAITSAMEKTMTALQNLGRLIFAQSSELINNQTNKGLPPNLSADDPSDSFTFKGFDVNMAAYMSELAYLAHPMSTHVQVAEMTNQSVNSMALATARYALEALEVLSLMAATYIYTLCQALDLRCMQLEFRARVREPLLETARTWLDPESRQIGNADYNFDAFDERVGNQAIDSILQRWDQLSHLDLAERCGAAVNDSFGAILLKLINWGTGEESISHKFIGKFMERASSILFSEFLEIRAHFLDQDAPDTTTHRYISPASRVVYDFVRRDLAVPLNRGVDDHPPLLLRRAQNEMLFKNAAAAAGVNYAGPDQHQQRLASHGRILGSMAGDIYEALRAGELHARVMAFAETAGMWH
ncbi:putative phenylalanine protein [Lasiosphaeria miniovina]|uniref:Phenylalanine protein n=1 Tax=Lasiosphaeria miniovina TaxID=1954250 RepID=A0AA40DVG6_9PEZI|nr:putative phenylalanine protein [Lasiosphaeria miniovina]KAK0713238.1 putative phenylalanine protein [Lasiosphaeria miniovina]